MDSQLRLWEELYIINVDAINDVAIGAALIY